jgi:hypothetical protein
MGEKDFIRAVRLRRVYQYAEMRFEKPDASTRTKVAAIALSRQMQKY